MGRTLLTLFSGVVTFFLILGLMLFAGVNWQTTVEVSFIFGPMVSMRLVVLLLACLAIGLLSGVTFVLRAISLGRRWKKASELKKEVKALRPRRGKVWPLLKKNKSGTEEPGLGTE